MALAFAGSNPAAPSPAHRPAVLVYRHAVMRIAEPAQPPGIAQVVFRTSALEAWPGFAIDEEEIIALAPPTWRALAHVQERANAIEVLPDSRPDGNADALRAAGTDDQAANISSDISEPLSSERIRPASDCTKKGEKAKRRASENPHKQRAKCTSLHPSASGCTAEGEIQARKGHGISHPAVDSARGTVAERCVGPAKVRIKK